MTTGSSSENYWLLDWADACGIANGEDATRVLADRRALNLLRDHALGAEESLSRPPVGRDVIVAGRGLDLSTFLACPVHECQVRQVDDLLKRAWLYFDAVVVDDRCAHIINYHWSEKWIRRAVQSALEIALYVRSIGAAGLVQFRVKPLTSMQSWSADAAALGMPNAAQLVRSEIESVAATAQYTERARPDGDIDASFLPADRSRSLSARIRADAAASLGESGRREYAKEWLNRYYGAQLVTDIGAARRWGVPAGCIDWLHQKVLVQSTPAPEQVLFDLQLPIVDGVPLSTLVSIRQEEYDAFERLRRALRQAATERIAAGGSANAARLASELRQDVVEPELASIRERLRSAERRLAKKGGVALSLGALATTCGILAGVAPGVAVLAGATTLATATAAAAAKHLDDESAVESSSMYFLWKAAGHARRHISGDE